MFSWLCLQSKDLHRLTVPWRDWAEMGYLTLVDDVEIHPDMLCEGCSRRRRSTDRRGAG